MTKPALYVAAGLPLMDKGQQAFEGGSEKCPVRWWRSTRSWPISALPEASNDPEAAWNAFWRKVDLPAAMVFIMAAFAGVGLAVLVSSALDRDPPIAFEQATVLTPEVPQGDVLDLQYTIVQSRVCAATVERFVIDSEGTIHVPSTLPSTGARLSKAIRRKAGRAISAPSRSRWLPQWVRRAMTPASPMPAISGTS